jgi:hypothetical protein
MMQLSPRTATSGRKLFYRGPRLGPLPQRVHHQTSSDEIAAVAHHEAAHAIVQLILGRSVWGVKIDPAHLSGSMFAVDPSEPSGSDDPRTTEQLCADLRSAGPPSKDFTDWAGDQVVMLMSGAVSQMREFPNSHVSGWCSDLRRIELLSGILDDPEEFKTQQLARTVALVEAHRRAIGAVAAALLDQQSLSGDQVRQLMAGPGA